MDTRRYTGLLLAPAFLSLPLFAQTPEIRFERLQFEHGAADSRVYDIIQDSIGFLWWGTSAGLYRYDGIEAEVFRPALNDTSGISSTAVWTLCAGKGGRLWIGTFDGGLDCFDERTESFRHFRSRNNDSCSLGAGPVRAIVEDQRGSLWVGTERAGLSRLDEATGRCTRWERPPRGSSGLPDNRIIALCRDSAGIIWAGTVGGLCSVDPRSGRISRVGVNSHAPGRIDFPFSTLYCARDGALWAGTFAHGLFRRDPETGIWSRYGRNEPASRRLFSDSITAVCQSNDGEYWIGTPSGLLRFDPRTGECSRHTHDPLDANSVSADYIRRIAVDNSGNVWIAADVDGPGPGVRGLNKIVPRARRFVHFRVSSRSNARLAVLSFLAEPGNGILWLGTMEGLRRFDMLAGRSAIVADNRAGRGVPPDIVSALRFDRTGRMWVGTWTNGLRRLDPVTGRFRSYDLSGGDTSAGNSITTIEEDAPPAAPARTAETTLWVGVFPEGLVRLDVASGKSTLYRHNAADSGSLGSSRVLATCVDRRGTLWVGTDGGGLNRLDRLKGSFLRFLHDDANPASLRSNAIYALAEDTGAPVSEGCRLWVGTSTGLDRFDDSTGFAAHATLLDSAAAIGVVSIRTWGRDLWVGTLMNGLFRVNTATGESRNYTSADGLYGDRILGAIADGPDGRLVFGAAEGFTAFQPGSITDNPNPPHIVLRSFSLFNAPVHTAAPLWTRPPIHLRYDEDFFSFRFAALDFTAPRKNAFTYRLDGFEEKWNVPGASNFAGYTKVDPGSYVFRVKGANSDGSWNEAGASIGIVIDPPFWKTWWFRLLAGLALVGLLGAAYNYRVARLLEMERMRLRIASDLHDDIGSSLSGIALVTDSLGARLPLQETDRRRLADVTRAARNTAEALREIVWIVNPEHETIDDILLRLKDIASAILVGVECRVTTSGLPASAKLDMEVRRNIILIFKEILNNVVKHAQARCVCIVFGGDQKQFVLRVTDDGKGFDPGAVRHGNGLDNFQRRARQAGGVVTVDSAPGRGTTVEFTVPLAGESHVTVHKPREVSL